MDQKSSHFIFQFNKIAVLFFLLTCTPTVVVTELWNNKTPKLTKTILKPIGTEVWKSYYKNGNLEYKSEYYNNVPDGLTTYWYENGGIRSKVYYNNGLLHLTMEKYYKEGNIQYTVEYFFGKKNGYERWYYDNGQLKSESQYENGIQIGEIIRWNKNGILLY